jgi:N6-L-threonylcarbamoyladenine synthase
MNILAFETSCDETAAAVVRDGRETRAGVVASQAAFHARYGGVVPEIASRKHIEVISQLTEDALSNAGMALQDINAVAVTAAPGLIGALLVGVGYAKAAAMALGVPLIPVHHIRGHVAACYLADPAWKPPFLAAVVSGGDTLFLHVHGYTGFRVLAATRDDAAGEAFDKVARVLGLGYPGGPEIDRLAARGDPQAFDLPRGLLPGGDLSFSGLKTAILQIVNRAKMRGETLPIEDLAASFTASVVETLVARAVTACHETKCDKICLTGGVAANAHLRRAMARAAASRGIEFRVPPVRLCGDNAEMIGAQGYHEFMAGHVSGSGLNAYASWNPEKALC